MASSGSSPDPKWVFLALAGILSLAGLGYIPDYLYTLALGPNLLA